MHPDIAYELGELRRSQLLAEAVHQRLVNEAIAARTSQTDHSWEPRRWWRVLRLGDIRPT